ncbi:MAG: serine/threonine protein kinase [Deltaproteobacteria bacterium]|nr:serine/threonine protein kinase [Deltaproteobacteria bacterium]
MTLRIERRIALGGMSEVFLAREEGHAGFARSVVLKRISPEHADDVEYVTMFFDEARLLAKLSHPHIAQVYAIGVQDGRPHLVMEHVSGVTLRHAIDRIARGAPRCSSRVQAAIGLALAQALGHAHARHDEHGRPMHVIHRDLTPSNVMVSDEGVTKLLDFGIAKWAAQMLETATDVVKGTYGYMAPEQGIAGHPIDHRVDVHALGVVLAELGAIDTPPPIASLLARCTSPDPASRPGSMREVAHALAPFAASTFDEIAVAVAAWR